MKKQLTKYILLFFFLGLFVYYYISNPEVFQQMRLYSFKYVVIGCLYTLVTITINGLFTMLIIDKFAKKMNFYDSFYTSFITTFSNYFLPLRAGSVVRASYLKKQYDFSYKNYISALYGNYVLIFTVSSLIGILSIIYIYFDTGTLSKSLLFILSTVFIIFGSLLFKKSRIDNFVLSLLSKLKIGLIKSISTNLKKIIEGWTIVVSDKSLLIKISLLIIMNTIAQSIFYYFALRAVGANISVAQTLLFTSITVLAVFISVTPGSIGIRETLLLIYSGSLMLSNENILSATLLDRGTTLVMLLILFVCFQLFSKKFKPVNIVEDTLGKKSHLNANSKSN